MRLASGDVEFWVSQPSFVVVVIPAVESLHGMSIDGVGDRLALGVADGNGARVVHAPPDSGVVPIRSRSSDARVRATRLTDRRQRKCLFASSEVAEEDGRR